MDVAEFTCLCVVCCRRLKTGVPRYLLLATCYLKPATCDLLLATCDVLPTTYDLRLETCYLLLETCYLRPTTYDLLLANYELLEGFAYFFNGYDLQTGRLER